MKTRSFFIAMLLLISSSLFAQVAINTTGAVPDNSAMLDVSAANKGLLIPRVALTGTNDVTTVISPAASLLVYNTATVSDVIPGFYYYNGAAWTRLGSGIQSETDPVFSSIFDVSGSLIGDFLKYDGTKYVKFTPNFTESNYLFNSRYGVKLLARNDAQTDVDFVISPKGNGAILAQQPDGTTAGGNIRGLKAVDLQMLRNSVTMVASGNYSTTIGAYNTASSTNSTAIGYANTASSASSTAIGYINAASGQYSTAIGYANTASGDKSVASGISNTAQSYGETVLGIKATIGAGDPNSFVSTDRLFVIGNGSVSKSDAFSILKNGNTTIGGSFTLNGNGSGTSYTFPINRGTNGQVLQTDGAGTTSWVSPAGGTVTGVTGTAPIVSSGGNAPAISISAATTSAAGSMSAADKSKLENLVSSQWITSGSNIYYASGNVGIGISPVYPLNFGSTLGDKISLYGTATNHYGFGIQDNKLQIYTIANNSDIVFGYGSSASLTETMRIKGNGQVGIGTSSPVASAALDVSSTNKGFLPPRVALTAINSALPVTAPAEGLLVYNTAVAGTPPDNVLAGYYFWNGTKWIPVAPPQGTSVGDMQYWNGTQWVNIPVGTNGQVLTLTNGVPTWGQATSLCGMSFLINHVAGTVAPVSKTVTYGTVTNIPGEPSKCWITSNLGSDHQATSVSDATEPSAGWYWQFNRKQGYKHDGTTRTPNTVWITSISESSDWITANDPCSIELGGTWRIPTYTEWDNVDNIGGWATWTGPWNSGLKLHAAGYLDYSNGSLGYRGAYGGYRSSAQLEATYSYELYFESFYSFMYYGNKAHGFPVRCVRDY